MSAAAHDALTWRNITLREAGVTLIDCDHRTPPAADEGLPYVGIPQMREGRLVLSEARRISPEHFADWTRKANPQPYDVVLSRRCNPGETAFVAPGMRFALGQNLVLLRSDGETVFPPFLRWLVRSPQWWEQVGAFINVGAVFDSLKCADIPKFTISLPPLPEQKAITAVLGALDDKIELNRRMNATLEVMARTLFQSWFVGFDPVRAKQEGRPPTGLDEPTAALFPNQFQNSEFGEIPQGWRVASIAELAEINGWTLSKRDKVETVEYVEISEVNAGNIANVSTYERGSEPSRARRRLRHGDSVLSTVRPDRRSYFLALHPPSNRVASTGFAVVTPTKAPWSFIHTALVRNEVFERLGHLADGAAYPAVRPEVVGALEVAMPEAPDILDAFHAICGPLFEEAEANRIQSRTLATLRDTLLPKLLSGEVSVCSHS